MRYLILVKNQNYYIKRNMYHIANSLVSLARNSKKKIINTNTHNRLNSETYYLKKQQKQGNYYKS